MENGTEQIESEDNGINKLLSEYGETGSEGRETGGKQSSNTSEQTDGYTNGNAEPAEPAEPIKRKRGRPKREETSEIGTPKETQIFDFVSGEDQDAKPVRETLRSRKTKRLTTIANGLRILAEINKASKPEVLKPIWEIPDSELKDIADSINDILPDLPKKAIDIFDKYSAYINVVAITSAVIVGRVMAEREIVKQIKDHYANVNNQTDGTIRGNFQTRQNTQSSNNNDGTNEETKGESFNFGFSNIFANASQI